MEGNVVRHWNTADLTFILHFPRQFGSLELHLVVERLLVVVDVTLERRHRPVVDQPDLLSHLVDQAEVVRHQHQTTIPLVDSCGQAINGLHIQVVRGLRTRRAKHEKVT